MADESFALVIELDARVARLEAQRFDRALGGATTKAARFERGLKSAQGVLLKFGAALGGAAVLRNVVQTATEFENLRTQLETVEGSAGRATQAFDSIKEFAARTPFQVAQLTESWINLRAKGFEPSIGTLRSLGDMAAAFGKDITQATQAATQAAFGEGEMLKQFGIIMRQRGEEVKLTFRGVTETVNKNSEEIFGALTRLAEVNFAGGMERQSRTFAGQVSTMRDAWANFADTIARMGIIDVLRGVVVEATALFESMTDAIEGAGLNIDHTFTEMRAGAAQWSAGLVRSASEGFAGVLRSMGRFISNLVLSVHRAPPWVRALLFGEDEFVIQGSAFALALADMADDAERFGNELADNLEEVAQDLLDISTAGSKAASGIQQAAEAAEKGSGQVRTLADALKDATERWREHREAAEGLQSTMEIINRTLNITRPEDVAPLAVTIGDAIGEAVHSHIAASDRSKDTGKRFGAAFAVETVNALINAMNSERDRFAKIGAVIGAAIAQSTGNQMAAILGPLIGGLLDSIFGSKGPSVVAAATFGGVGGSGSGGGTEDPRGDDGVGTRDPASAASRAEGGAEHFARGIAAIMSAIQNFEEAAGVIVGSLDSIHLELLNTGQVAVSIAGSYVGTFATLDEAVGAALSMALRAAEISGATAEVSAAIKTFAGGDFNKLLEMVEFARTLSSQIAELAGVGAVGQLASINENVARLTENIKALGLSAELEAQRLAEVREAARIARADLRAGFLGRLFAAAERAGVLSAQQRARLEQLQLQIAAKRLEIEAKALGMWNEFTRRLIGDITRFAADFSNFTRISSRKFRTPSIRLPSAPSGPDPAEAAQERLRDFLIGIRTSPGPNTRASNTSLQVALRAAQTAAGERDIDSFIKFAGEAKNIARQLFGTTRAADAVMAQIEGLGLGLSDTKTFRDVTTAFYGDNLELLGATSRAQTIIVSRLREIRDATAQVGALNSTMRAVRSLLGDMDGSLRRMRVDLQELRQDAHEFYAEKHQRRVNQIVGANQGTRDEVQKMKIAVVEALG